MITEDDLVRALRELADAAPERCTSVPSRPIRRPGFAVSLAALVVTAALIALAVLAAARPSGGDTAPAAGPPTTPVLGRPATSVAVAAPVLPTGITARERRALTRIARADVTMNGDPHARATAVRTTYGLLARHHAYLVVGAPASTPASTPAWVLWYRGEFDDDCWAFATVVDGRAMHDLGSTLDVDTGYGLSPTVLSNVGVLHRLF